MNVVRKEEHYTYQDYAAWPDDERVELIDGVIYDMPPAPNQAHQLISAKLMWYLTGFLIGKPCKAFPAPFDVRLNADHGDDTVVQPDISVVCDASKLNGKNCAGAPDFVVEILSPSTAQKDLFLKYKKFLEASVKEYWIVHPDTKLVQAYTLKDGVYVSAMYSDEDTAPVSVLPGLEIDLREVFTDIGD